MVATSVRSGEFALRSLVGIVTSRQPASVVVKTVAAATSESAESSLGRRKYSSRVMPPQLASASSPSRVARLRRRHATAARFMIEHSNHERITNANRAIARVVAMRPRRRGGTNISRPVGSGEKDGHG